MWPWTNYFTFLVLSLPFAKIISFICLRGFPCGASGKESACQRRRHKRYGFDSWVGKIPWKRAQQPTPVFLARESYGQWSLVQRLQYIGSPRGGHDWSNLACTETVVESKSYPPCSVFFPISHQNFKVFCVKQNWSASLESAFDYDIDIIV